MKMTGLLAPLAVAAVRVPVPKTADASKVRAAVKVVDPVTLTLPTVTPAPLAVNDVAPGTKLVPVNVTFTVVPAGPVAGDTVFNLGEVDDKAVKIALLLTPVVVETVT